MAAAGLTAPSPAPHGAARPASIWRAWLRAYALLWAFTLGSALLVAAVPGASGLLRHLLRLKLSPSTNPPPSITTVISIASNNILRAIWPLALGPLGARHNRFTRTLADGAMIANLLVPGLLVGGALGGYGLRILPFVPHVPVEWAGIAAGASGWLIERKWALLNNRSRVSTALVATSLLACGATVEVCLIP